MYRSYFPPGLGWPVQWPRTSLYENDQWVQVILIFGLFSWYDVCCVVLWYDVCCVTSVKYHWNIVISIVNNSNIPLAPWLQADLQLALVRRWVGAGNSGKIRRSQRFHQRQAKIMPLFQIIFFERYFLQLWIWPAPLWAVWIHLGRSKCLPCFTGWPCQYKSLSVQIIASTNHCLFKSLSIQIIAYSNHCQYKSLPIQIIVSTKHCQYKPLPIQIIAFLTSPLSMDF